MPANYDDLIAAAADKYGIDPDLFKRQIKQESGFKPDAVSKKGAIGLGQVMPETAKSLGYTPEDMTDPAKNIDASAKFMAKMYKHAQKNNPSLAGSDLDAAALAAYNAGPGGALSFIKTGDINKLPNETKDYIAKISGNSGAKVKGQVDPFQVDDILAAYKAASSQNAINAKNAQTEAAQEKPSTDLAAQLANEFKQGAKPKPAPAQQPQDSSLLDQAKGYYGAVIRGGSPTAIGATLGAAMGAPTGIGAVPGALAGAGAGFLTQAIGDPATVAVNNLFGTNFETPSQALEHLLDKMNVPRPQTEGQQLVQALTSGLSTGGIGAPAAAASIAKTASSPVTKAVASQLAANPALQGISGGAAAGSSELARQEGLSPEAQLAAGLVGGIAAPMAAGKVANVMNTVRASKTPALIPEQVIAEPQTAISQAVTELPAITPKEPVQPTATVPIQPAAIPKDLETLSQVTKKAITNKTAQKELAAETMPDKEAIAAAKRLGIEEHLQPDHVTTNQSYRELAQAIKSFPGSELRAKEIEGLQNVANRANKIVEDAAATKDISELSSNVKAQMSATQQELEKKAGEMYKALREKMPSNAEAPADNVLGFITQRAEDLGGIKNLTSMEKMIYSKLSPKTKTQEVSAPLMSGSGSPNETVTVKKAPNYALLDDVRRDLTAARVKNQGAFKDADSGLVKILESKLKEDQGNVLAQYGLQDDFALAQKTVAVRKSLEDDMLSLFGKQLEGNIVSKLQSSIKNLSKGDTKNFDQIIKSVPENMRENVATSGLSYAFGRNANDVNFNTYANWFEGIKSNKQAYETLSKYLKPDVLQNLNDFYKVSNGIRLASKERIQTGRLNVVKDTLKDADTAVGKIYESVKGVAGKAVAAEIAATSLGAPGAGLASGLTAALVKEKVPLQKAADKLLASDEFNKTVQAIAKGTTNDPKKAGIISKILESTPQWKDFVSKLPKSEQEKIVKIGAVQWLISTNQKEGKK